MTFARMQALTELIGRYKAYQGKSSFDEVVVIISFDIINELKTKCSKSMNENVNGQQYFMGCKVIMSHGSDYLAVAYLNEMDENFHDIIEITEEDAK